MFASRPAVQLRASSGQGRFEQEGTTFQKSQVQARQLLPHVGRRLRDLFVVGHVALELDRYPIRELPVDLGAVRADVELEISDAVVGVQATELVEAGRAVSFVWAGRRLVA
jgi:hypothetical protein